MRFVLAAMVVGAMVGGVYARQEQPEAPGKHSPAPYMRVVEEDDGATIKLQLPVLHIQKLATKATVEDGGTIMVSRTKATDKGKCVVMFVTVRKAA